MALMVNFNISELRGYHGRWMLGGPSHPHIRRHRGLLGSAVHAAESGYKDAARAERISARDVARSRRAADSAIIRTGERMARAQGIGRSELSRAERAAGIGTGRGPIGEAER